MTEKKPVLTDYESRRIETITAPVTFSALHSFVEEVCLRNPLPEKDTEQKTDAALVAQLGLRGLRAAIEASWGATEHRPSDEDDFFVKYDEPMKDPQRFSDSVDMDGVAKTERLGQGLLNESFVCLGADAQEQIEKFKNATGYEEQVDVMLWLEQRLREMTKSETAQTLRSEDDTFYHPLRLSPKLIGTFPEHTAAPTCLGVSIIAASFLEQTGADVLHAGVMKTRAEEQRASAFSFFHALPKMAQSNYGVTLPLALESSLQKANDSMLNANLNDRGYHAAVFCRMKGGHWFQLDPNFQASGAFLADHITERLDEAHKTLNDFNNTAPGLELGVEFSVPTLATLASALVFNGNESLLGDSDDITRFLREGGHGSVAEHVKNLFVMPYFRNHESDELKVAWNQFVEPEFYDEVYHKVFNKYVLWGDPLENVLARCRNDAEYCRRRAEDIRQLPLTLLASLVASDVNDIDIPIHQAVEVGLPASRIGAAVMNDFANFYGQGLPASYRMSQWPSHIPLTEVTNGANDFTDAQRKMIVDNASWQFDVLHYSKGDGIIVNTLIRERRRQVQNVGESGGPGEVDPKSRVQGEDRSTVA